MNNFFIEILEQFDKKSPEQIKAATSVADTLLGLHAERDAANELRGGAFSHSSERKDREDFAKANIRRHGFERNRGNKIDDPYVDGTVRIFKMGDDFTLRDSEFIGNPTGEERTYKIMHSPDEPDEKFTFEVINGGGGKGDVFESLEKVDWLVWVYENSVLLCDAKKFLEDLLKTYNSDDRIWELAVAKEKYLKAVEENDKLPHATKEEGRYSGWHNIQTITNNYINTLGEFARFVLENDGSLSRGKDEEFLITISPQVLVDRYPVQEYQIVKGVVNDDSSLDAAKKDRAADMDLKRKAAAGDFDAMDALIAKIVDGTYIDSEEFDNRHLRRDPKTLKWVLPDEGQKHWDRRTDLLNKRDGFGRAVRKGPPFQLIPRLPEDMQKKIGNYAVITDRGLIYAYDSAKKLLYTFYHWDNPNAESPWATMQRYAGDVGTEDVDEIPSMKSIDNLAHPTPNPDNLEKTSVNPLPYRVAYGIAYS